MNGSRSLPAEAVSDLRALAREAGMDLHVVSPGPAGSITHAEVAAAEYAAANNIRLRGIGASNNVCANCQLSAEGAGRIRELHPEAQFDSPLRRTPQDPSP